MKRAQASMGINRRIREKRKRDLIEATIDVLAAEGQAGLTLGKVAKRARLAVGLVNFHFGSKAKLLAAVFRHLGREFDDLWEETLAAVPDPAARPAALVAAYFDPRIFTPRKLAVWFVFWSDARLRDAFRRSAIRFERRYILALAASVADLLPRRGGGKALARRLIDPVIAMIDGYWLQAMIYGAGFDREAAIENARAVLDRQIAEAENATARRKLSR